MTVRNRNHVVASAAPSFEIASARPIQVRRRAGVQWCVVEAARKMSQSLLLVFRTTSLRNTNPRVAVQSHLFVQLGQNIA